MSDTVISVENLSKSYLVGHQGPQERYHSLRDTIVRHGKNYVRKAVDMARGRQIIQGDSVEEFWALKDVSFEVKRGEVLGIIGRNGAGKSTLLKILSRITEPTSGRVVLDGRVASLLEVGTGFHPELTGRENIFLNGAILGMSKVEIKRKFDEIVDFAGVEKFLDTPVKRYSSGMYVRLAFSVAAHLEPEILIIDEVLAVGDAEFQKKCLGKMQDVAKGGRTVLFVSHNMGAVANLCSRALSMRTGRVVESGDAGRVIENYLMQDNTEGLSGSYTRPPDFTKDVQIVAVRVLNSQDNIVSVIAHDENWSVEVECGIRIDYRGMLIGVRLTDAADVRIATLQSKLDESTFGKHTNSHIVRFNIAGNQLVPRALTVLVAIHIPNVAVMDQIELNGFLKIIDGGTAFTIYAEGEAGVVLLREWNK